MTAADRFMLWLYTLLGIPYRWGGANPLQGLDCSGLAQLALGYHGLDPAGDQTADALYRHLLKNGKVVTTATLGTLAFYGRAERATHVTVCLDDKRMIEAGGGDHTTTTLAAAAARGAYVRVSQITRRSDLVALIHPSGMPW